MNTLTKVLGVATFGFALAVSMTTPSAAAGGRHAAAAIGFGAGLAVGAAAGSYDRGYAYDRGYGRDDSGYGDYAYEPGPVYAPDPGYRYRNAREWNADACTLSPGSPGYTPCNNQ
jgi:hypothetical protein